MPRAYITDMGMKWLHNVLKVVFTDLLHSLLSRLTHYLLWEVCVCVCDFEICQRKKRTSRKSWWWQKETFVRGGHEFSVQLPRRKGRLYFRIRPLWPDIEEEITSGKIVQKMGDFWDSQSERNVEGPGVGGWRKQGLEIWRYESPHKIGWRQKIMILWERCVCDFGIWRLSQYPRQEDRMELQKLTCGHMWNASRF